MESTATNALSEIFAALSQENVPFDDCRVEIRQVILKNLKRRNTDEVVKKLSDIALDIAYETFRKKELFSGNVDARKIRAKAVAYGFEEPTAPSDQLLTVKRSRNDLAHGVKSFSEVGRQYDVARLKTIHDEVVRYLDEFVDEIERYLKHQEYLERRSDRS